MSRPAILAAAITLPLVAGATWLWAERGWLILIDLASISVHGFCL